MSQAAQRREEQQRALEKPKLDKARKLRGIYFIDPEGIEFKETMKNARKKVELPVEAAMPCEVRNLQHREAFGKEPDNRKSKHACIVEAHESARKRLEKNSA